VILVSRNTVLEKSDRLGVDQLFWTFPDLYSPFW